MNEEEVKVKLVLPWLREAGFDLDDLQLERTFSIRIGRNAVEIGRQPTASGRLDILVRAGDRNLFVIETKAENLALDEDDRDQAISYARLVHPIAPYAVVTNGRAWHLYDTITKQETPPSSIRVGAFQASLPLPPEDVAEAQQYFLRLNPANLVAFCKAQAESMLREVKGTAAEGAKYVPQLHVPREHVGPIVDQFFAEGLTGLVLVGESGAGKTCELCHVVESLLGEGRPVLFFNGFSLLGPVDEAVQREFAWSFSGPDAPVQVLRRLEACTRDGVLTIAIDAIDEWQMPAKARHLAALLRECENRRIRFLLSCKTAAMPTFLRERDNPTWIERLTRREVLQPWSGREFLRALENYREAYGVSGGFETAVMQQARDNPFLLRVLFEVAQSSGEEHLTFSSAEFFTAYFGRAISRTADPRQAEETLKAVAQLLYETDSALADEAEVRARLGFRVHERIMDELFEFNLLVRSVLPGQPSTISFYFQQLRDYIVAFEVRRFPAMEEDALRRELREARDGGIRLPAITLYYRLAKLEHRLVFDGEVRANATVYLQVYQALATEQFPAFAARLDPEGVGPVGFVGHLEFPRLWVDTYGWRRMQGGDEAVHFLPVLQGEAPSNLSHLAGVGPLLGSSSNPGFRGEFDIEGEVRQYDLAPQIRRIVAHGRLDESAHPQMLREYVVQTVQRNRDVFSSLLRVANGPVQFPLPLESILPCIRRAQFSRQFGDEIVERKRKTGEIQERWRGDQCSYSVEFTGDEREEIAKRSRVAVAKGATLSGRSRYVELEAFEARLVPAVQALGRFEAAIDRPPPFTELEPTVRGWRALSTMQLAASLQELYMAFLANYRRMLETNFPTLKHRFGLYAKLPVTIFLELRPNVTPENGWKPRIHGARSIDGQDAVRLTVEEVAWHRGGEGWRLLVAGVEHEAVSLGALTSGAALSEHFVGMPLRWLVYAQIQEEWRAVEREFVAQRGRSWKPIE